MAPLQCWVCKKRGHKKVDCWFAHPEKRPADATQKITAPTKHRSKKKARKPHSPKFAETSRLKPKITTHPITEPKKGMKFDEAEYQRHLALCRPDSPKPVVVDRSRCFLLNKASIDIRQIIYRIFFSAMRPKWEFRYDFQEVASRYSRRGAKEGCPTYNWPYSFYLLLTCRKIHEEAGQIYHSHSRLLLRGIPSTVPKLMIREHCQHIHIYNDLSRWPLSDFKYLKIIGVSGQDAMIVTPKDCSAAKVTKKMLLDRWKSGAKEFLVGMQKLQKRTSAVIKVDACIFPFGRSGFENYVSAFTTCLEHC